MRITLVELRPMELIYIQALLGCIEKQDKLVYLEQKAQMLKEHPDTKIRLVTAYDESGNKTELYDSMDYMEMKMDLDILQKLGYVPGSTRTSRIMFEFLNERIPDLSCFKSQRLEKSAYLPENDCYIKGKSSLVTLFDNKDHKKESCKQINNTKHLMIRIHHLLCMTCFMDKGDQAAPIPDDNLFEFWDMIRRDPDILITVTEGCEQCMICPPCNMFDSDRKRCISQGALRDRKKDLDAFAILNLVPGDTYPARDLLKLIYNHIETIDGICDYGKETSPEWKACQGDHRYGDFKKGRMYIKEKLDI